MTSLKFKSLIAPICVMAVLAGSFSAQAAKLRNDPNRPTAKVSAELGVTQDQFIACFWDVNPEENGKPSGEKQRVNKAILLPCLQEANPSITNDLLDSVMDKNRPEGPIN